MEAKVCPRCERSLSLDLFAWKSKAKGRRASECRECHTALRRAYYEKNRSVEIENARRSRAIRRPINKAAMKRYKATLSCNRCGFAHPAALQFHHSDPEQKEAAIANMLREGRGLASIMAEAAKCEVLCANCHLIEHYSQFYSD